MTERRVLLGIASGGSPTKPFLDSLAQLKLPDNVAPLKRSIAVGNFIPAQRELIMNDAVAEAFDYLFFVDDDIQLPERALEMLVPGVGQHGASDTEEIDAVMLVEVGVLGRDERIAHADRNSVDRDPRPVLTVQVRELHAVARVDPRRT